MKWNLLVLSCSLLITSNAFAIINQPTKCPIVSAITATSVDEAAIMGDGNWLVGKREAKYDTDDVWSFGIPGIKGKDATDAVELAKRLLPSLTFIRGPVATPPNWGNRWVCIYQHAEGNAYAVTPHLGTSFT